MIINVILEESEPETPPVKENTGCSVNRMFTYENARRNLGNSSCWDLVL